MNQSEKLVKAAFCKECGGLVICAAYPHVEKYPDLVAEFAELEREGHDIVIMPLSEWNEQCDGFEYCHSFIHKEDVTW